MARSLRNKIAYEKEVGCSRRSIPEAHKRPVLPQSRHRRSASRAESRHLLTPYVCKVLIPQAKTKAGRSSSSFSGLGLRVGGSRRPISLQRLRTHRGVQQHLLTWRPDPSRPPCSDLLRAFRRRQSHLAFGSGATPVKALQFQTTGLSQSEKSHKRTLAPTLDHADIPRL